MDYYSEEEVQRYCEIVDSLDNYYSGIQFIYMTGRAQAGWARYGNPPDYYSAVVLHRNNNIIRNYCGAHNKILYDFADLDCWHNGEQSLLPADSVRLQYPEYTGPDVPREHPDFVFDGPGHTNDEACMIKVSALWQLAARLNGWGGIVNVEENDNIIPAGFSLLQNYPNPFNPETTINFSIIEDTEGSLKVFDILVFEVANLVENNMRVGEYSVKFNVENLSSGIYFYRIEAGSFSAIRKMVLLK